MNQTIFQFFHWYYSPEGNLWQHVTNEVERLAALGFTHIWLPPAYKSGRGVHEPGYAVYDLYDLGEFDQQGTIRTRYGTKEEYLQSIDAIHKAGMKVLTDIVLNHKTGADEKEKVHAHFVHEDNRWEHASEEIELEVHTKFTFPGRKGKYSDFIWNHEHFTGVCEDHKIALLHHQYSEGKWDDVPETEKGSFDFLMGCDIEFRNPEVIEELKKWGVWYVDITKTDGFRLDAVKHINSWFFPQWLEHINKHFNKNFECIAEYWKADLEPLKRYIEATNGAITLFDVPLHFRFYDASLRGKDYDLRTIFDNTLVKDNPDHAVTFVDNHDTQPMQSLQSTVDYWFKPLAYALILLRVSGKPVVFYPAMYEAKYFEKKGEEEVFIELNKVPGIEELIEARRKHAYGDQHDYFDHPNVIGWTREGTDDIPGSGCAVILSNGDNGFKKMYMGKRNAGKTYYTIYGHREEQITIDENGEAEFAVNAGSVAVWVEVKK